MMKMSSHAIKRAAQRNLSPQDIAYVVKHGSKVYRAGACFYYLGEKDILKEDLRQDEISRLEGTILVIDPERKMLLTLYRDRENGFKEIRKKRTYYSFAA